MSAQESIINTQKIYSYTQTPEITRLLYVVFKEDIDKEIAKGNRVISIEFASTKRLVEWIEKADCSLPVVMHAVCIEEGVKYISAKYPNTAKILKDRDDVCVILLQTYAILFTQCFASTAILPNQVDVASIQKKFPKHLLLKH